MGSQILKPRDILSIIELIYYVPVLLFAVFVCRRHGFRKQLGWLSVVVLACFRIAASVTWIAASYDQKINGLVTASIILQSFGMASTFVAIQGLLSRVNQFLSDFSRISIRTFKLFHLATSAAIGLAMAGGIELGDSAGKNGSQGHTLQRAAMIIFIAIFIAIFIGHVHVVRHRQTIPDTEHSIVVAVTLSMPLLGCRLLCGVLAVFDVAPGTFSSISQKDATVIVTALMAVLPEFIIAAMILRAGFLVPRLESYRVQVNNKERTALEA